MKKICYWSPHLSNVATIKNVINSAISLKKYKKEKVSVKIYDVVGEWTEYEKLFHDHGIEIHKFSNLKLKKFLPITGYLKSRLVYIMIFIFKIYQLKKILIKEKPDFLILFSWHIKNELKRNLRKKGFKGKFIIPLPNPKIEN